MIAKKIAGFDEIYTIAYRKISPNASSLYMGGKHELIKIADSKKYWYADPMLFHFGADTCLFMEAFEYKKQKGRIAYSKLLSDGTFSRPEIIIEEKYHMSFPVVFEWGTEIYIMPETSENKSLNLYRCIEFPYRWEKEEEFDIEAELVDAIIIDKSDYCLRILAAQTDITEPLRTRFQVYTIEKQHDGCTIFPYTDYNEKQFFTYDTRNAGCLFKVNGELRHPVQVSTEVTYGVRVDVYHYRDVSQIHSKEFLLGSIKTENILINGIKPEKMIGIHSYCRDNHMEIIDVKYYQFSLKKWYYRLHGKLSKNGKKQNV